MPLSSLEYTSGVEVDKLNPGVANRIKEGMAVGSLDEANNLITTYQQEIAFQEDNPSSNSGANEGDASASNAGANAANNGTPNASDSTSNNDTNEGNTNANSDSHESDTNNSERGD